jgi:hypothetical protein
MNCPSCGNLGIAAVKAAKAEVVANDFQANRMPVRAIDRMPAPVIPDTEAIYAD